MTVQEVANQLQLKCIAGEKGFSKEVKGVYCGDVLSLAIAHVKEGDIWLTVQGHVNTVAIAVLMHLSAIILVQGISAKPDMIEAAQKEEIMILSTSLSCYEMALALEKVL